MSSTMRGLLLAAVALILLASCGAPAAPVAPTSQPAPPTPTPTLRAAAPRPGATFAGAIEISGKASSATIRLGVSADGTAISSVAVSFNDLRCDGFSAGSMTKESSVAFPVAEGKVAASVSGIGEVKGQFGSATEASGTISLTLQIPFSKPCELGEWRWSAKAN